jgi:hypothetical protein
MDDEVCADCKVLQQEAPDATLRHFGALDRLARAKIAQVSEEVRDLEAIVERMFRERTIAVRTFLDHFDTHTQVAASKDG